jgi:hypothetical protein
MKPLYAGQTTMMEWRTAEQGALPGKPYEPNNKKYGGPTA